MTTLKILTKQSNNNYSMLPIMPKILSDIEEILGYNLEVVDSYDNNFDGYYLMPNGDHRNQKKLLTIESSKKIFLLGITNSDIPEVLDTYNPIGLVQWRFFKSEKPIIHGLNQVVSLYNFSSRPYGNNYCVYTNSNLINKEKRLAKAIIDYINKYDKYVKNQ